MGGKGVGGLASQVSPRLLWRTTVLGGGEGAPASQDCPLSKNRKRTGTDECCSAISHRQGHTVLAEGPCRSYVLLGFRWFSFVFHCFHLLFLGFLAPDDLTARPYCGTPTVLFFVLNFEHARENSCDKLTDNCFEKLVKDLKRTSLKPFPSGRKL